MDILVISNSYPSVSFPQKGTFVYELVQKFTNNNKVTVIAPFNYNFKCRAGGQTIYQKDKAIVYRPKYLSLSNKKILDFNTYSIGKKNQISAIKRAVKKENIEFQFVYAHFISNVLVAIEALSNYNKPFFVAVGENFGIEIIKSYYKAEIFFELLNKISGFIAVSNPVKYKLLELGISPDKIIVEPNSVDLKTFNSDKNKIDLKKKYNLPLNKKTILFVGHFIESKGPLRVLEAIQKNDLDISVAFVGHGIQDKLLKHDKIAFKGALLHSEVAEIMAASDIFILPTLHEGSSNAIVEAMASGLPIISSRIPEVESQCDEDFSILVNPMDIDGIAKAIKELIPNEQRLIEMSKASREKSKSFDLDNRADSILNFIKKKIN